MTIGEMFGRLALMVRRVRSEEPTRERIVYVPQQTAGVRVTQDNALTVSSFWAGVRAITDPLSYISWHVFQQVGKEKRRRSDLWLDWLLNSQPNDEMSAGTFRETILQHGICWGNGYAEIERFGSGQPAALWPLMPDRVCPDRTSNGDLYYDVYSGSGPNTPVPARDMFHLKGLGFDGLIGYSVVQMAARSLGLSMALEDNASAFFANGSQPSGTINYAGKITEETREATYREWQRMHSTARKRYKMAVFDQGTKYEPISMSNVDSQMIDSRKLQVTEVARWLKVPPHKLADLERATFSNIEEQNIDFVSEALMPWINRLEQEANIKLFGPGSQGRLFTRLNIKGLLRGKMVEQAQFIQAMMDRGVYDVDEAREFLDMDPIGEPAGGTKRFVPLNMQLLENAGEEPPAPEPVDELPEGDNPENDAEDADEESDAEPVPNNRLNGAAK